MPFAPINFRDGNANPVQACAFQDPSGVYVTSHTTDSTRATYRACIAKTLDVPTPTVVFLMRGSATKTVRVKSLHISGWSTALGTMRFRTSRRTGAGVPGPAVLTAIPNQGPLDPLNVAPTATAFTVGTANYTTVPTLVSLIEIGTVGFNTPTDPFSANVLQFAGESQATVLRGTSDVMTISSGPIEGAGDPVPAGGQLLIVVEWIEDLS